jgi:hypothetical protein
VVAFSSRKTRISGEDSIPHIRRLATLENASRDRVCKVQLQSPIHVPYSKNRETSEEADRFSGVSLPKRGEDMVIPSTGGRKPQSIVLSTFEI